LRLREGSRGEARGQATVDAVDIHVDIVVSVEFRLSLCNDRINVEMNAKQDISNRAHEINKLPYLSRTH
jgi:hypothetical protein